MAKKGSFSFAGMIDPGAEAMPIEGVEQRGAGDKPEVRKRGRPPKARTTTEARPSFGLDPQTHAKFKIWLLRRGMSMQDYLEAHITELVKDEQL